MSTTGSMGWADEHELEETRSVKGHSNPIGARDIERERMSEHQIRDQLTRAHRWQQMRIELQQLALIRSERDETLSR